MSSELASLAAIVAALAVGVVSPGPSFLMVARTAVAESRPHALAAALGMGVGALAFSVAALVGLHALFTAVPALFIALKVLGGLYLCHLGLLIFRSARQPLATEAAGRLRGGRTRAFLLGLTTQVSHPKTAVVYASVFAAFLPEAFTNGFAALLLAGTARP